MTKDQLAGHVAFFGCDDEQGLGDAVITWEDDGHSGAGWYIHCGEYPEEGSVFLSANHEPFPALLKLLQGQAVRDRNMVPNPPTPDAPKGEPHV